MKCDGWTSISPVSVSTCASFNEPCWSAMMPRSGVDDALPGARALRAGHGRERRPARAAASSYCSPRTQRKQRQKPGGRLLAGRQAQAMNAAWTSSMAVSAGSPRDSWLCARTILVTASKSGLATGSFGEPLKLGSQARPVGCGTAVVTMSSSDASSSERSRIGRPQLLGQRRQCVGGARLPSGRRTRPRIARGRSLRPPWSPGLRPTRRPAADAPRPPRTASWPPRTSPARSGSAPAPPRGRLGRSPAAGTAAAARERRDAPRRPQPTLRVSTCC